jgi:hypothetical protein
MQKLTGFPLWKPGFDHGSINVEFLVDKLTTGQVFPEYFGSLCQFSVHQMLYAHPLSGTGIIGQLVADVPSGLSLTPPNPTKLN